MSDDNDKNYPELDPKEVAKRLEKEKGLVILDSKGRSVVDGKFKKGGPGGPGRPKKVKTPETTDFLTDEDRSAFLKDGKVHSKAALQRLLETAQTRAEAVKIASLLIQYDAPKLSAVETKSTEDKSVTITWNLSTSPQLPEPQSSEYLAKTVSSQETEKETNLIGAPELIIDGDSLTLTELPEQQILEEKKVDQGLKDSEDESDNK